MCYWAGVSIHPYIDNKCASLFGYMFVSLACENYWMDVNEILK